MLTCSVQSGVVQFCGLVSVFLVRKMGDLALHSALDARLETKKKKTYLTREALCMCVLLSRFSRFSRFPVSEV